MSINKAERSKAKQKQSKANGYVSNDWVRLVGERAEGGWGEKGRKEGTKELSQEGRMAKMKDGIKVGLVLGLE